MIKAALPGIEAESGGGEPFHGGGGGVSAVFKSVELATTKSRLTLKQFVTEAPVRGGGWAVRPVGESYA